MEEYDMSVIKFHVDGLPPKKNGANSMWSKRLDSERLVSLRRAALENMSGHPPLKKDIRLAVTVCIGDENKKSVGDLDTFVTGICDGLMKATANCRLCREVWDRAENDIRPDKPIAIDDDYQVIGIQAAKIKDSDGRQYYDVTLEGE